LETNDPMPPRGNAQTPPEKLPFYGQKPYFCLLTTLA
jgi:hypothetical protein